MKHLKLVAKLQESIFRPKLYKIMNFDRRFCKNEVKVRLSFAESPTFNHRLKSLFILWTVLMPFPVSFATVRME